MQAQYFLARLHDRGDRQQLRWLEHVAHRGLRLIAVQNHDTALVLRSRIAHRDVQQESIELRLGQGIRALLLNRVLRRHDHEQVIQLVAVRADRNLALFHSLEQCRLHLRRCAVDLVSKNQIVKQRSLSKFESAFLRPIDIGTREIRRQQIGRELHTMKIAFDTLGEHLDRTRLCEARSSLHEQMAIAQQCNEHAVDQMGLTNDQATRVRLQLLYLFYDRHSQLRSIKRHQKWACHSREDARAGQPVAAFIINYRVTSVIMAPFLTIRVPLDCT